MDQISTYGCGAGAGSAGAGPDPVAIRLQLERDVGVDANDRRAAVDHGVLQAGADARKRARHRRVVP